MIGMLRATAFVLYAAAAFMVFFYATFPYSRFERFLLTRLHEQADLDVTIERGRLLFPLGMIWNGVTVDSRDARHDARPYALDLLKTTVAPFAVLRGRLEVRVETAAYGGRGAGGLSVTRQAGTPHYRVWATVREVDLARLPATQGAMTGQATLAIDGQWDGDAPLTGSGQAHLDLARLQAGPTAFKGLTLPAVTFASIRLRTQWRRGVVDVTEFAAHGPEMTMTGNGSLLVRDPFRESLMNLLVQVTMTEGGKIAQAVRSLGGTFSTSTPVEASVKGTVGHPAVSVNNIPLLL